MAIVLHVGACAHVPVAGLYSIVLSMPGMAALLNPPATSTLRHFVDVAHFQADDAVLDVVDDADAVFAAELPQLLDQVDEAKPFPR